MTDESTMMPKSTAPIDSRLADLPRRKSIENVSSTAGRITNRVAPVVFERPAHDRFAQAGLEPHDHALPAHVLLGTQRPALDHILNANGDVVDGGNHDLTDFPDAVLLLGPKRRRR